MHSIEDWQSQKMQVLAEGIGHNISIICGDHPIPGNNSILAADTLFRIHFGSHTTGPCHFSDLRRGICSDHKTRARTNPWQIYRKQPNVY